MGLGSQEGKTTRNAYITCSADQRAELGFGQRKRGTMEKVTILIDFFQVKKREETILFYFKNG